MTELLLQSALAASKSRQLAAEAARIKTNCLAQHGENKSLVTCPECYEALLEAVRTRYLGDASGTGTGAGTTPDQPQQREWFASRRAFLSALDLLIDSAKEYQLSPRAVDDRVRDERGRWYAERVRAALLRLLVEHPSGRGAVFEKLEDLALATARADPAGSAAEIAELLSKGPLVAEQGMGEVPERLAAAKDQAERVEVLRRAFFANGDGTVPEDHQKYLDMLLHQGSSMEQVVDRILEERQAAVGAREQTNKFSQRLDELRRARAAHELQKSRKAQRRESLAQQRVPDELYELPACAVCGSEPSTRDFFSCNICTILAGTGAQERQTVFCSQQCQEKGQTPHAETHTCSSASNCIQLHQQPAKDPKDPDVAMQDDAPAAPTASDIRFCTECLTTLKQPTVWCSPACAAADFQRHREEVHLPERRKRGLAEDEDEAQLEYLDRNGDAGGDDVNGDGDGGEGGREDDKSSAGERSAWGKRRRRRYRAKDIGALTTSVEEAVREWEGRNRVRLQCLE